MNYEKIVHALIDDIVEDPKSVFIRVDEEDNGKDIVVTIAAEKQDTARLIGHKGIIANALREIMNIAAKSEDKYVHVKFESFDEEKSED